MRPGLYPIVMDKTYKLDSAYFMKTAVRRPRQRQRKSQPTAKFTLRKVSPGTTTICRHPAYSYIYSGGGQSDVL